MRAAPGIKLGRTDTTYDLSLVAEKMERKKGEISAGGKGGLYGFWERRGESCVCAVCLGRKLPGRRGKGGESRGCAVA